MDASRLLRFPILVEHVDPAGPPDGMGDPTEITTWTRFLGYVWQTTVAETTGNITIEVETWQLAIVRAAAGHIDAGDRIIAGGELDPNTLAPVPGIGDTFNVAGPPWTAKNPRTMLTEYVQAKLERSA